MKRTIATLAVCLLAICSQAQSAGKAGQTAKKTMGFIENFDLAKKEASAFKQPVFALFLREGLLFQHSVLSALLHPKLHWGCHPPD